MKERYDIGVIIGRFQVDELHPAHLRLLNEVKENHEQMLVLLGVPATLGTKRNPLPYPVRAEMIREKYPDALITHLMDNQSDIEWSKTVDQTIRMLCPFGSVCIYGGRDSFIPYYHGVYPTYELAVIPDDEGSALREKIGHRRLNTRDFRAGIIYSCQNQYPKVFQTVDMAITKTEGKKKLVFMGRRKKGMGLRFGGGFVDPTDANLEAACLRERTEEFDIETSTVLNYVGSNLQQDWRYKTPDARIMTVLFQTEYIFGTGKIKDEFEETEWIEITLDNLNLIEDAHKTLFEKLCKFMNPKTKKEE